MAQNTAEGPKIGFWVVYTPTPGTTYSAQITAVDKTTGLVRLNVHQPGAVITDQQNVGYDGTRNTSGTWSWQGVDTGI